MKYLIDTSALVRIARRQADPRWYDDVSRGLVGLCEPVLVETLTGADAKTYDRLEGYLRDGYPWVGVPDDVWAVVGSVQRELAAASQHHGLSVADHLVVATAIRLKLVVLHEDADFETVARHHPAAPRAEADGVALAAVAAAIMRLDVQDRRDHDDKPMIAASGWRAAGGAWRARQRGAAGCIRSAGPGRIGG